MLKKSKFFVCKFEFTDRRKTMPKHTPNSCQKTSGNKTRRFTKKTSDANSITQPILTVSNHTSTSEEEKTAIIDEKDPLEAAHTPSTKSSN